MAAPSKPILAISIDFGTTFSGISYQESSKPPTEPSEHFTTWPRVSKIRAFHKVPTVLAYPRDPTLGLSILWGFEAERLGSYPEAYIRCAAFKPLLDTDERDLIAKATAESGGIQGGLTNLPAGKEVNDLTKDFLELLWEHFESCISERGYSKWNYDYHIIFTVPATFSERTVEKFRRIVERTKIGACDFEVSLTEPEAAGMYAIYKQPVYQFKVGDAFVVCDAGGGTVDLASYTILKEPPEFKLDQTGVISGDFCGSSNINKAFQAFFISALGATNYALITPDERYELLRQFNERKEEFEDDESMPNQYISLPHSIIGLIAESPQSTALTIKGNTLAISATQMKLFFQDCVERTVKLLTVHIDDCLSKGKEIKYIYLVGGFGTSPYLKSALASLLTAHYGPTVPTIVTPQAAQLAVTDGALRILRSRLSPTPISDPISTRLLRTSYGLLCSLPYNPSIHPPTSPLKYTHPTTGTILMRNQIIWLARRGDRYPERTRRITAELRRVFRDTSEIWVERVLGCDLDPRAGLPSSWSADSKTVRTVALIHTSLSLCPIANFTPVKHVRPGTCGLLKKRVGYEVKFGVVMKVRSAGVGFETVWGTGGEGKEGVVRVEWELGEKEAEVQGVEVMGDIPGGDGGMVGRGLYGYQGQ